MSDNFTEVTTTGWGQPSPRQPDRMLFGIVLIPASIILLYRNEGRAVGVIRALDQCAAQLAEVSPDAVDPAMDRARAMGLTEQQVERGPRLLTITRRRL